MKRTTCQLLVAALLALPVDVKAADKTPLDGELVYRNNCTRCHMAIHTFPEPMMTTVIRHMRVRATLTQAEADAVLKYLSESSPAPSGSRSQRNASRSAENK